MCIASPLWTRGSYNSDNDGDDVVTVTMVTVAVSLI